LFCETTKETTKATKVKATKGAIGNKNWVNLFVIEEISCILFYVKVKAQKNQSSLLILFDYKIIHIRGNGSCYLMSLGINSIS
jgi:hypothetical protein